MIKFLAIIKLFTSLEDCQCRLTHYLFWVFYGGFKNNLYKYSKVVLYIFIIIVVE